MQKFKLVKMGRKLVNISMGLIGMSGTLVAGTGLAMANGEKILLMIIPIKIRKLPGRQILLSKLHNK